MCIIICAVVKGACECICIAQCLLVLFFLCFMFFLACAMHTHTHTHSRHHFHLFAQLVKQKETKSGDHSCNNNVCHAFGHEVLLQESQQRLSKEASLMEATNNCTVVSIDELHEQLESMMETFERRIGHKSAPCGDETKAFVGLLERFCALHIDEIKNHQHLDSDDVDLLTEVNACCWGLVAMSPSSQSCMRLLIEATSLGDKDMMDQVNLLRQGCGCPPSTVEEADRLLESALHPSEKHPFVKVVRACEAYQRLSADERHIVALYRTRSRFGALFLGSALSSLVISRVLALCWSDLKPERWWLEHSAHILILKLLGVESHVEHEKLLQSTCPAIQSEYNRLKELDTSLFI